MPTTPIQTLIMSGSPSSGISGFSGRSGYSGITSGAVSWRTITSANATLAIGDAQSGIIMNSPNAQSVTIPTNATVAFPVGSNIIIISNGIGIITVVGAGGVTLNYRAGLSAALKGQYSAATVIKTATDTWLLMGDIGG